jgi:hypothetical protein
LTQINAVIIHFGRTYRFYAGATGCGSGERSFVGVLPIVPFVSQKKNFRPLAKLKAVAVLRYSRSLSRRRGRRRAGSPHQGRAQAHESSRLLAQLGPQTRVRLATAKRSDRMEQLSLMQFRAAGRTIAIDVCQHTYLHTYQTHLWPTK